MTEDRKIIGWFTANGKHIPIFEEEPTQDEQKKDRDIAQAKQQADVRNNKLTSEQDKILNALRLSSEIYAQDKGGKYGGYMPKSEVIDYFLNGEDIFESQGWNKKNDEPATSYTNKEDYELRYFRNGKMYTREQAKQLSETMFDRMVQKGLLILSSSGKGVKVK